MVKYTGINHLAMVTGDMDATIGFWRDLLGMRLVAGLGKPGYRHYFFEVSPHGMIAFFDPNNIAIEFSVPVPEVDLRAHPAMKDSRPTPCAQEGPDPRPGRWPEVQRPTPMDERQVFPVEGEIFRELGGQLGRDGDWCIG